MLKKLILISLVMSFSATVNAAAFWKTGTISRTLTDHYYGGCMIYLSTPIGNGCPNNGWVSLDCNDKYFQGGERMYSSAIVAKTTKSRVSLYIHNDKKHNGYCVARRLDIL